MTGAPRWAETAASAACSAVLALIAAGLWVVWDYEQALTSIRAPWTGVTYAASVGGFVAAGYFGRGVRALLIAAAAAAAALVLVDPLVWQHTGGDPVPITSPADCDPGCISTEAAATMGALGAAFLAAMGIVLRRAAQRVGVGVVGVVLAVAAVVVASGLPEWVRVGLALAFLIVAAALGDVVLSRRHPSH